MTDNTQTVITCMLHVKTLYLKCVISRVSAEQRIRGIHSLAVDMLTMGELDEINGIYRAQLDYYQSMG